MADAAAGWLDDFRRLAGDRTGPALVDVMQASRVRSEDLEPRRSPMPVRDVEL